MTRNPIQFSTITAFMLPLVVALGLVLLFAGQPAGPSVTAKGYQLALLPDLRVSPHLRQVTVRDADDLRDLFSELNYAWPPQPGPSVPRVAVDPLPAEFDWPQDVQRRKDKFFQVLTPLVLSENKRVLNQRTQLELILADLAATDVPPEAPHWAELAALAERYQVDGDLADPALHHELLSRIDILPLDLVLSQAANESGWGTSRFAREGNNLFGVWTYDEDSGMVPEGRPEGETYLVRRYDTLQASVRSHLFTINIGQAYDELRAMRAAMRERGEALDALALAGGLERYSIRGEEYIEEIREIIRFNDLGVAASVDLREPEAFAATMPRRFTLQVAAATAD